MNSHAVIVGGGLVGCLSALRLREAGLDVTVLEKGIPGAEASSAAAGILAAQSEGKAPGTLFDLGLESRELYARLSEELKDRVGADVGFRRTGVLDAAMDPASLDALANQFAWQRERQLSMQLLDARALREVEGELSPSAVGGVYFPDDAQIDPPRLVAAVAQAAERAGVEFRSGSLVRRVRVERDVARGVDLDGEFVPCDHVVIAAGAWSALVEGTRLPEGCVRPARGQIVELALRLPPVRAVVFGAGGYVVPRADGRVLCGSTLEFVGFRNEVTAGGVARILGAAITLVPALEHAAFTRSWANFRPYSVDGMPLIGDSGIARLTIATGHYRSGILMAPITAELVRERVCTGAIRRELPGLSPQRASLASAPS